MIPEPPTKRDVELISGGAAEPLVNTSNFYTLYYLTRVKDVEELSTELDRFSSKLKDAYGAYGYYAVTRELMNTGAFFPAYPPQLKREYRLQTGVDVDENLVTFFDINDNMDLGREEISTSIADFNNLSAYAERVLGSMQSLAKSGVGVARHSESDVEKIITVANNNNLYESPVDFFKACEEIFEMEEAWSDQMSGSWGGENWAAAARFMRQEGLTDVSWLDQCFAIQHNSNVWMDKLELTDDEERLLEVLPSEFEYAPGGQVTLLNRVLDKAREGDMEEVFAIAVKSGKINGLRKYKRVI